MSKMTENASVSANTENANVNGTVAKKVNRRGIGTARGTTRLKFTHELAKRNGLFIGHLNSVVLSTIKIGEDTTGMPSFNGLEIPKLTFEFASNEEEVNKRHYASLSFTPVESNVETIPGGKSEWKVTSVFDWLKHILDVYVLKGRELTDEEANALSLPFEDFDENGEYVAVDSEDVVAGWKTMFENIEAMMNRGNDGKPYYKTKDGKDIPVWMKLLRHIKTTKKGWINVTNGDLAFPSFVGEGCIEVYKTNTPPSTVRVDIVKESINPRDIKTAKDPNMNNIMGNMNNMAVPNMGGVTAMPTMDGSMGNLNEIANAAGTDMPF